jgi:hypothetical protein
LTRPGVARAAGGKPARIKVGQIGTGHAHAAGKLETLRKFSDDWEVVGLVEPNADRRAAIESNAVYRDVPLLTEEQLLNTPGLAAVAVETEVRDLVPTARRCVAAGVHVHVDKPGGESLDDFAALLDEATRGGRTVQMATCCATTRRSNWPSRPFAKAGWATSSRPMRPLEPARIRLALEKPRGSYQAGYQDVNLPELEGRYDGASATWRRSSAAKSPATFPPPTTWPCKYACCGPAVCCEAGPRAAMHQAGSPCGVAITMPAARASLLAVCGSTGRRPGRAGCRRC